MPDGKQVLKIAKNEAGIAQNKQELEIFLNPSIAKIYTDIYEWDKGKNWLITEYVQPFNSRDDFQNEIGIIYSFFEVLLSDIRKWLARDLQDLRDLYEMLELSKTQPSKYDEEEIKNKIEGIDKISKNEKAYNFVTRLINLMQRGLIEKDFVYKHFGKSNVDGKIKLYDYGYSIDVDKKHYK